MSVARVMRNASLDERDGAPLEANDVRKQWRQSTHRCRQNKSGRGAKFIDGCMSCQRCSEAPFLYIGIFELLASSDVLMKQQSIFHGQDVAYRTAHHPVIPIFVHHC